jgi:hypothetical protein
MATVGGEANIVREISPRPRQRRRHLARVADRVVEQRDDVALAVRCRPTNACAASRNAP